jgi:hypothetical protein
LLGLVIGLMGDRVLGLMVCRLLGFGVRRRDLLCPVLFDRRMLLY